MTADYQLSLVQLCVGDHADPIPFDELAALVASGDCFVTLATQLDALSHQLPEEHHQTLEIVIRSLMDLQRRYRIVSKTHDYRQ